MPIPEVMLNDDIKASTGYLEYLAKSIVHAYSMEVAKSIETIPAKAINGGKGLLTKNGVEFAVKMVSILKRKRSQTVIEEIGQSEEAIDDGVDSKETDEEEVEPLVRHRFTRVSIGKEVDQRTTDEEERVGHSKKRKGLETLSAAAQLKLDMKKAHKANKDSFFIQQRSKGSGEGSGVTPEVPDVHIIKRTNKGAGMTSEVPNKPSGASSSSSFDSEIAVEDIYNDDDDDEVTKKPDEVTENTNEVTKKDDKVSMKPGVVTENADNVTMADDVQPAEQQVRNEEHGPGQMSDAQLEKPEATIISSSHTLSSTEFTNQFLNKHADVNLSEILKDPVETKVQSMVDVPVKKATPAALRHPLVDSTVTSIHETTTDPSVYRLERKVVEMSKFNIQAAIDKLIEARLKQIELPKGVPDFKKIKLEKAAKQNVRKSSWNKTTTAIYDQKCRLYKMMEEVKAFISHQAHKDLYDALAASLSIDEDDMDRIFGKSRQMKRKKDDYVKDPSPNVNKDSNKRQKKLDSHKNDKDQAGSSKQGKSSSKPSKSNKPVDSDEVIQDVETYTRECVKDVVHDFGPTAPFPELEKTAEAPKNFDDVMGSTFDFLNFIKYRPKKDTLTKADIEGLFDWKNPDIISQDFSKPLSLLSAHGRQYIPAEFFFNQDLEYLKTRNLEERKYTASLTKIKAMRISHWGPKRKLFYRARQTKQSDHIVYSRMEILSIVRINVEEYCGYGYLKEIVDTKVGRSLIRSGLGVVKIRYDTKGVKVRKGIMQTKTELTLEQTQQGVSDEVLSDTKVLTVTMEILPEPTSNKLCG
ncbi:hypothetical protein Tco_0892165, partial [Tanacetum coccineum]